MNTTIPFFNLHSDYYFLPIVATSNKIFKHIKGKKHLSGKYRSNRRKAKRKY